MRELALTLARTWPVSAAGSAALRHSHLVGHTPPCDPACGRSTPAVSAPWPQSLSSSSSGVSTARRTDSGTHRCICEPLLSHTERGRSVAADCHVLRCLPQSASQLTCGRPGPTLHRRRDPPRSECLTRPPLRLTTDCPARSQHDANGESRRRGVRGLRCRSALRR